MNEQNGWGKVRSFFERIGKRNLIIAGAVLLIAAAVAVNWIIFAGRDDKDGYTYDQSAGMSTSYGTNLTTTAVGEETGAATPTSSDTYFSSVEISRQRARDEAMEVLNAVVDNDKADEAVKADAMRGLQAIAREMEQEANIESLLESKGFEKCVAVVNSTSGSASIVVKNPGALQAAQLAQINAVVYEQTGILPLNITIVQKD